MKHFDQLIEMETTIAELLGQQHLLALAIAGIDNDFDVDSSVTKGLHALADNMRMTADMLQDNFDGIWYAIKNDSPPAEEAKPVQLLPIKKAAKKKPAKAAAKKKSHTR